MPRDLRLVQAETAVIGAGLAGWRAALAAIESAPGSRVTLISLSQGPSGSSFANLNARLGIQVCQSPDEISAFQAEALAAAEPGYAVPELIACLAQNSAQAFNYLRELGASFEAEPNGAAIRHTGCFSPRQARAYILNDLPGLYRLLRSRFEALGGVVLEGLNLASLKRHSCALLFPASQDQPAVCLAAKSLVLGLGGAAPLFEFSLAGPGNPGYGLGILNQAGIVLVNTAYLQFMWSQRPRREFFSPAWLGLPGWRVLSPKGRKLKPDEEISDLPELSRRRSEHCPYGHSLPDNALDHFLARNLDDNGLIRVIRPEGQVLSLAPHCHASNGGALIDENGQTSVPGIFACGECASGMHGANRLGGGMVLASQVFGARAGTSAAAYALNAPEAAPGLCLELAREELNKIKVDAEAYQTGRRELARAMQKHCALGGEGLAGFASSLENAGPSPDWRLNLTRASGLLIAQAQLAASKRTPGG